MARVDQQMDRMDRLVEALSLACRRQKLLHHPLVKKLGPLVNLVRMALVKKLGPFPLATLLRMALAKKLDSLEEGRMA